MRHKTHKHSFGRKPAARAALVKGLVNSLVTHERICTTLVKAKELRRHVEKAITYGKKGSVHARRQLLADYPNQDTVQKIVGDLSVRFKERPGGYTRIIKIGPRVGDKAEMAFIEFVDYSFPTVAEESQVKADSKGPTPKEIARKKLAKKKSVRQLQNASRRKNR